MLPAPCTGEFCRKSRRKCDGQQPCAECAKRGIACVYAATSRKRGPKSTRVRELELQVSMLREQLRSMRDCAANFVAPRPDGSAPPLPTHSAGPPLNAVMQLHTTMLTAAPIDPTAEEEGILRTYFEYSNRLFPCVPEPEFYRALTSSAYDTADAVALAAAAGGADATTIADFMEQNKQAMGFRSLFYTVLGVGARLQARQKLSMDYLQVGMTYLSLCFCQPSQPSAAAMTLMAITMRVVGRLDMASCYSALAQRMCEMLEVDVQQRLCTLIVYYMCCGRVITMPPPQAPDSVPPAVRFADILGFIMSQLSHDFPDVTTDDALRSLDALVAEAVGIQRREGYFAALKVGDLFPALRTLMLLRLGRTDEAIEAAKAALAYMQTDKLAPFNFPFTLIMRRIRDLLRSAGQDTGKDTDGVISIADRVFKDLPGATSLEDFQRLSGAFARSRLSTSGLPMTVPPLTAVAASALASLASANVPPGSMSAPPPPASSTMPTALPPVSGGLPAGAAHPHMMPPTSQPAQHQHLPPTTAYPGQIPGMYGHAPAGTSTHALPPAQSLPGMQFAQGQGAHPTSQAYPGHGFAPSTAPIMAPPAGSVGGTKRSRTDSLQGHETYHAASAVGGVGATPGWGHVPGTGDASSVGSNDFFDALINPALLANMAPSGAGSGGADAYAASAVRSGQGHPGAGQHPAPDSFGGGGL